MPPIGQLDRRISIERNQGSVTNDLNETVEVWAPIATVWARKRDVSDGERAASGQVGSTLQSRFVIRSSPAARGFTPVDRLVYNGVWQIHGIKELDEGRNRFLEITAIRALD